MPGPGPINTWDQNWEIDDGTMCRMPSRAPGPIGRRHPSMLARGEALGEAYLLSRVLAPEAILKKTGYALGEVLKGLLPGLIQMVLILGATTSLGAAAGGVIGFFLGGVGAAPGVVVGGELGFDIGTAILTWLGVGFLAKAVVEGFGEIWAHTSAGVTAAWAAPEYPPKDYPRQIRQAAEELADATATLVLVILQGALAYYLGRAGVGAAKAAVATGQTVARAGSEAAADESVAALLQQLRGSRLGPEFADWVEKNWAKLKDDPRLRFKARPPANSGAADPPALPKPKEPPKPPTPPKYKTTPMKRQYVGEDQPGNAIWGSQVKYLSESERAAYKLEFRNGEIYDSSGRPFDTSNARTAHSGRGRAIFVMDEDGNFYASKVQKVGEFHHSSLAAGQPVAAAGELDVENGVLKTISDKSGHYQPGRAYTDQALDSLQRSGVDTSNVQQDFIGR
jgi:hypothetical protein